MHCLVYHVPDHMRQYGNLWVFSGQGELGESLNIVRTVFLIPLFFCVAAIIVMTTLSGIVEGRVCL